MTASGEQARPVWVIHALRGRTRLRTCDVPLPGRIAERLADDLAHVSGVKRVEVNRLTGGILVTHAPELARDELVAHIAAVLGDASSEQAAATSDAGRPLDSAAASTSPASSGTGLAREIARFFRQANHDLLRATDGALDIGTATTLGFLTVGAVQVAVTQRLPAPPWFNLAWWGFRTFMTLEHAVLGSEGGEVGHDNNKQDPHPHKTQQARR